MNEERGIRLQANALVVYESMFGSTQAIAHAVAAGLRSGFAVTEVEVSSAPTTLPLGLDLLVVAGPTHAFGLSRPSTRASAAEQATCPLVSQGNGVREWLAELAPAIDCGAAAIDTRQGPHFVPGSAARGIEARLRHLGYRMVATAESFWVTKEPGGLVPGELQRAERWGRDLADLVLRDHPARSWSHEQSATPEGAVS